MTLQASDASTAQRILLATAVWVGLSGATWANQQLIVERMPGDTAAAVSVVLWIAAVVVATLVVFLLAGKRPLPGRLRWTARTVVPLALQLWLLSFAVYGLKVISVECFAPLLLAGWRIRKSHAGWAAGLTMAVAAFPALAFPGTGPWLLGGTCILLLLLAQGVRKSTDEVL
jgi:hypothetical protein